MSENQMRYQAREIMRDYIRKNELVQTAGIAELVPPMMDAVTIDVNEIQKVLEGCMKNSQNSLTGILNFLVGWLGLRVVKTKGMEQEFDSSSVAVGPAKRGALESVLTLINSRYEKKVDAFTKELKCFEDESRNRVIGLEKSFNDLSTQLDKVQREKSQLQTDMDSLDNLITVRAQYMLGQYGIENLEDPMARQLLEMLTSIGVQVYWTAESAPFSPAAAFQEIPCTNPQEYRATPCLAKDTKILQKGVRFVSED